MATPCWKGKTIFPNPPNRRSGPERVGWRVWDELKWFVDTVFDPFAQCISDRVGDGGEGSTDPGRYAQYIFDKASGTPGEVTVPADTELFWDFEADFVTGADGVQQVSANAAGGEILTDGLYAFTFGALWNSQDGETVAPGRQFARVVLYSTSFSTLVPFVFAQDEMEFLGNPPYDFGLGPGSPALCVSAVFPFHAGDIIQLAMINDDLSNDHRFNSVALTIVRIGNIGA